MVRITALNREYILPYGVIGILCHLIESNFSCNQLPKLLKSKEAEKYQLLVEGLMEKNADYSDYIVNEKGIAIVSTLGEMDQNLYKRLLIAPPLPIPQK
jgi:hypothetical protein